MSEPIFIGPLRPNERPDGNVDCYGCRYDIPGNCLAKILIDGRLVFPSGYCFEPEDAA